MTWVLVVICSSQVPAQEPGDGNGGAKIPQSLPTITSYIYAAHLSDPGESYYSVLGGADFLPSDGDSELALDAARVRLDTASIRDNSALNGSEDVPKIVSQDGKQHHRVQVPVILTFVPPGGPKRVLQRFVLRKPTTLASDIAEMRVSYEPTAKPVPRVTMQFWVYSETEVIPANWELQIFNVKTNSWENQKLGHVKPSTSRIDYHKKVEQLFDNAKSKYLAGEPGNEYVKARIKLTPRDNSLPTTFSPEKRLRPSSTFNPWRDSPSPFLRGP